MSIVMEKSDRDRKILDLKDLRSDVKNTKSTSDFSYNKMLDSLDLGDESQINKDITMTGKMS